MSEEIILIFGTAATVCVLPLWVGKTHVLCNIRTGLTDEDEAHLFVTQEENVTKLTQYDKFIAACASGEEHGKVALLLRDICDEYGIKIKKACGKNSAGVLTAISVAHLLLRTMSLMNFGGF